MTNPTRQHLRLRYRKDHVLMYTSHLDLLRLLLRLLRRVELPFATSGSFSPKPRVTFGPALPLGISADNELLDIELADGVHYDGQRIRELEAQLALAAEPLDFVCGLTALAPGAPPISREAVAARYRLGIEGDASALPALLSWPDAGELAAPPPAESAPPNREKAPKDPRLGIISFKLDGGSLSIDGGVGNTGNLSVTRLGAFLEEHAGVTVRKYHRAGLLDAAGRLL